MRGRTEVIISDLDLGIDDSGCCPAVGYDIHTREYHHQNNSDDAAYIESYGSEETEDGVQSNGDLWMVNDELFL